MAAVFSLDFRSPFKSKATVSDVGLLPMPRPDMNALYEKLQARLKKHGAEVQPVELTDSSIYLVAQGMRDAVLAGLGVWEKISVLAVATPTNEELWRLVFSFDGYYTGGGSTAPPRSVYKESMEPRYFKELEEFARSLANNVVAEMGRR